ncbi:hypothetical protein GCM10010425_21170 [Streptomyces spororaveus]
MRVAQGVVFARVPVLAQQMAQEALAREADRAVDVVHGEVVARLPQGLPPADDVQVIGIDEGAVDIEQRGTVHLRLLRGWAAAGYPP